MARKYQPFATWRFCILALVFIVALTACSGDEKEKPAPSPDQTEVVPTSIWDATEQPTEQPTDAESDEGLPPDTVALAEPPPINLPDESFYEEAVALARADLSTRLGVSVLQIQTLASDTELISPADLECPPLAQQDVTPYVLYLEFEHEMYPYQFYRGQEAQSLIVEACQKTLTHENELSIPEIDEQSVVTTLVKADLAKRGVPADEGTYVIQDHSWTDKALNCPLGPDEETEAALVEGYLILYTLEDTVYEYHTDQTGENIRFCEPPLGYDTAEDFITALEANGALSVERTENTITYTGLDSPAEILLLSPEGYRVGMLGFDSESAARAAAQKITDPKIAHLFVAGHVLIVQERMSTQVFAILLQYAELIS